MGVTPNWDWNIFPGAPTNIDGLIYGLQSQNISLLIFRGHTYYLAGATYDEYIGLDGGRMLQVKELRLANTFAGKPELHLCADAITLTIFRER